MDPRVTDGMIFLFAITAVGVVPRGGPKKSPRTPTIVQFIFSFWSFEFSERILRNQKFIIGLTIHFLTNYIWLCLDNTSLCINYPVKVAKLQYMYLSLAPFYQI